MSRLGYYNNFFVAKVAWWMTPIVNQIVRAFDDSDLIFIDRTNDLVFQTAVITLLTDISERHHYLDWSYQHHTIVRGVVTWGGLETGSSDQKFYVTIQTYINQVAGLSHPRVTFCPTTGTYAVSNDLNGLKDQKFIQAPACSVAQLDLDVESLKGLSSVNKIWK
jgi:hypothetical protein